MKYQSIVKAPFGAVGIVMVQGKVQKIDLLDEDIGPDFVEPGSEIEVAKMIRRYLQDPSVSLDTPFHIEGTIFQQRVWEQLRQIPVGETRTYGELADILNTSARAIGNACRSNPCPLVIPCHRVVGKANLGGYSGQVKGPRMEMKCWLLRHEGGLSGQ